MTRDGPLAGAGASESRKRGCMSVYLGAFLIGIAAAEKGVRDRWCSGDAAERPSARCFVGVQKASVFRTAHGGLSEIHFAAPLKPSPIGLPLRCFSTASPLLPRSVVLFLLETVEGGRKKASAPGQLSTVLQKDAVFTVGPGASSRTLLRFTTVDLGRKHKIKRMAVCLSNPAKP